MDDTSNQELNPQDQPPSSLDQDRAKWAQAIHQGLDQYLGGVRNLAPKSNEQAKEMALDATPIVGNVRSAQRGYEAAQNHDWLGAALGAVGAVPLVGGIFLPAKASQVSKALLMEKQGRNADHILQETGAFRDVDNRWKREISDKEARITPYAESKLAEHGIYGGQAEDMFEHPHAYIEEPVLTEHHIEHELDPSIQHSTGSFQPYGQILHARGATPEGIRGTMLHEMQHAVDFAHKLPSGANIKMYGDWLRSLPPEDVKNVAELSRKAGSSRTPNPLAYDQDPKTFIDQLASDMYWRDVGEVRARNTELRKNMSEEERRNSHPFKTMDIPAEQQIGFKRSHGGSISDGTHALLGKLKRDDGGPVKPKGSFQAPSMMSILKDIYPDMVPPSGSFVPQEGLQSENFATFAPAIDSAFKYTVPPNARESTNVEDRRFTHPSLPTSDMGNYDFPEIGGFRAHPKPTPPAPTAGVQGMAGAQSGPSITRGPWATSTTPGPFDTQLVPSRPSRSNGGGITDGTRQLLAKLKNRA